MNSVELSRSGAGALLVCPNLLFQHRTCLVSYIRQNKSDLCLWYPLHSLDFFYGDTGDKLS
jgi:hypothetical protein